MIVLTLPYPISANRYWATRVIKRKGCTKPSAMTYVTPEAEAYRREIAWRAKEQGLATPLAGRVELRVQLFPDRPQDWAKRSQRDPDTWDDSVRCIDLGNCEKVLSDALNGVAWVDDKQLRKIVLERMEPDDQPGRVVVSVFPFAGAQRAPELFGDRAA